MNNFNSVYFDVKIFGAPYVPGWKTSDFVDFRVFLVAKLRFGELNGQMEKLKW